jgi:hypothetical protein
LTGRKLLPGRTLSPAEIRDYQIERDNGGELFSENFLARLIALNAIVRDSGETIEGSLFYRDREADFAGRAPDEGLAPARRNLWRASRFKRSMLEVGVNAGHAALLCLSANVDLVWHGLDICEHAYVEPCVAYLAGQFPGRVHFHRGDSREALPRLATHRPDLDFDLFHVDGGHTDTLCRADVSNCLRLARGGRGKHLVLDDVHASWIFDVYCEYVSLGQLATETLFADWEEEGRNLLARIL